eukprot:TRINITY_DN17233_c0_g1_i1.p1 TRINITY_DN17233_c0_g1~~TRINITY_DN17233_c0_g1_i1.p1  ORF type:complete len:830 (-),score=178.73 TRINITY_DN17233_c0_g1_i1:52-2541(-)
MVLPGIVEHSATWRLQICSILGYIFDCSLQNQMQIMFAEYETCWAEQEDQWWVEADQKSWVDRTAGQMLDTIRLKPHGEGMLQGLTEPSKFTSMMLSFLQDADESLAHDTLGLLLRYYNYENRFVSVLSNSHVVIAPQVVTRIAKYKACLRVLDTEYRWLLNEEQHTQAIHQCDTAVRTLMADLVDPDVAVVASKKVLLCRLGVHVSLRHILTLATIARREEMHQLLATCYSLLEMLCMGCVENAEALKDEIASFAQRRGIFYQHHQIRSTRVKCFPSMVISAVVAALSASVELCDHYGAALIETVAVMHDSREKDGEMCSDKRKWLHLLQVIASQGTHRDLNSVSIVRKLASKPDLTLLWVGKHVGVHHMLTEELRKASVPHHFDGVSGHPEPASLLHWHLASLDLLTQVCCGFAPAAENLAQAMVPAESVVNVLIRIASRLERPSGECDQAATFMALSSYLRVLNAMYIVSSSAGGNACWSTARLWHLQTPFDECEVQSEKYSVMTMLLFVIDSLNNKFSTPESTEQVRLAACMLDFDPTRTTITGEALVTQLELRCHLDCILDSVFPLIAAYFCTGDQVQRFNFDNASQEQLCTVQHLHSAIIRMSQHFEGVLAARRYNAVVTFLCEFNKTMLETSPDLRNIRALGTGTRSMSFINREIASTVLDTPEGKNLLRRHSNADALFEGIEFEKNWTEFCHTIREQIIDNRHTSCPIMYFGSHLMQRERCWSDSVADEPLRLELTPDMKVETQSHRSIISRICSTAMQCWHQLDAHEANAASLAAAISFGVCLERFNARTEEEIRQCWNCLLYTSPSPRDRTRSRMPSSA